jgi:hypothetical protein
MTKHLHVKYANPLEREYEAWIVAGIERYLKDIGLPYAIWAISPDQEKKWPSDEKLKLPSKVVGLQFKQAKLAKGAIAPDRLNWSLHQPSTQFSLVKSHKEIFYCLPTFINRDLREQALHHCLFWRPDLSIPDNKNVWYDNPAAHTPYKNEMNSMRWGLFLEMVLDCNIGAKVTSAAEGEAVLERLTAVAQESANEIRARNEVEIDLGFYALAVGLES